MERNNNLELLRVCACVMVVLVHVSKWIMPRSTSGSEFLIGNFINSFSLICVPLFVIISGYFVLNNTRNTDIKTFYTKYFFNIVVPVVAYSLFYIIYSLYKVKVFHEGSVKDVIYTLAMGKPYYHLWYMYMLIGLYLLVPFIIKAFDGYEDKVIFYASGYFLAMAAVSSAWYYVFEVKKFWPLDFVTYLGYFIFGMYLARKTNPTSRYLNLGMYFFASAGILILSTKTYHLAANHSYFFSYVSVLTIVSAIGFFNFIRALKINANPVLSFASKYSFRVYLVHAFFLDIIFSIFGNDPWIHSIPLISILVIASATLALSYSFSLLVDLIGKSSTLGSKVAKLL
ncbi:acyltransferase [Serratia proteamaculans]|uniref:acyltransferase n=1 Tax=Serratia proteamaculans TaxID=28151 RepID=UPI0021788D58|nr:acyltransferase family protein [Serratia proteamaculans]CAI1596104.1 Inner membrane protein YiaH [Serratia proteamaculans]